MRGRVRREARGARRWAAHVALWALVSACVVLMPSSQGAAQDGDEDERVYTIALYAPDVSFGDSVSKAGFAQRVAAAMTKRTGMTFRGISFGRAGDLGARAGGGGVDYAILGGMHFAAKGGGKPVAGSGSAPVGLLGKGASVASLRGKTLILPHPSGLLEGFVTGSVLGGELTAKEFFGTVKYTKDVQSALTAVKIGQADATVAFTAYASQGGLQVLFQGPQAPLPVIVQVNTSIPADKAAEIAKGFRGLGVGSGGLVRGFGGGLGAVGSFRGLGGGKRPAKRPSMTDGRQVRVRFDPVRGPKGREELDPSAPRALVPAPALPPEE